MVFIVNFGGYVGIGRLISNTLLQDLIQHYQALERIGYFLMPIM